MNHPHYEDVGARERTKAVYTVFSRREVKEVHDILATMQVGAITTPKDGKNSRGWPNSVLGRILDNPARYHLSLIEPWYLSTQRGVLRDIIEI